MTIDVATKHRDAGAAPEGRVTSVLPRALATVGGAGAESLDRPAWDRRRPGRPQHVSPELVGLLRWRPAPDLMTGEESGNPMAAAQGITLGLLLGALTWAGSFWLIERMLP